jgi:hypothetical protein
MSDETAEAKKKKPYPRRKRPLAPPHEPIGRIMIDKHHALFRPPQGHDWQPEKFERIYVKRFRPDGELEEAQKWFPPEELADIEQLRALFGGGRYELHAIRYDGSVYRIVQTNRLPGPPKPMFFTSDELEQNGSTIAPLHEPTTPQPVGAGGDMIGIFQLIMSESRAANERMMMMMQQNAQAMAQMQQHSTQVLVAALTGNKQDTPGMITALAGAMRSNNPPTPPIDPIKQTKDILDLTRQMQPAAKEETVGEIVGTAVQAIGAMTMLQGGGNQQPPQNPPLPPSGNGSVVQG